MDSEKSALIREIQGMMGGGMNQRSSYDTLGIYKMVDKLLIRLGIFAIIGLLGYIAIKGFLNNRSCRTTSRGVKTGRPKYL